MTAHQFLETRFAALCAGDYAVVYDSYHEDSPFLQQFSGRNAYIHFAQQQLGSIAITSWRCLRQRVLDEKRLEVLLVMDLGIDADSQFFYELALLIETERGWHYHSAQKLGADDYHGLPDQVDFCHFDSALQKIRF
ncbi:MAG: hypothetical protein PF441_04815 [Desulfuromusa sp.]|jgi:SEC-C motif-containing protein|nr:hypothetical protein [Desulfuromusa sp.]